MGQQRGTFYWDDDSLSPGKRSDGGWSENLFDDDGNLRGHARFIPDLDSDDDGYTYSPYDDPPMFMSSETRRESEDEDNSPIIDLLAEVLAQVAFSSSKTLRLLGSHTLLPGSRNGRKKRRSHSSQASWGV